MYRNQLSAYSQGRLAAGMLRADLQPLQNGGHRLQTVVSRATDRRHPTLTLRDISECSTDIHLDLQSARNSTYK